MSYKNLSRERIMNRSLKVIHTTKKCGYENIIFSPVFVVFFFLNTNAPVRVFTHRNH